MPKRISIRADLKIEELEQRYRQASGPVARSPWQSVWLLAQGQTREEVEEATGSSLTWIRTIARRSNAVGEIGIDDRRHAHRGGLRLLSRERAGQTWIRHWRERRLLAVGGRGPKWPAGVRTASARARQARGPGWWWRRRPACAPCSGSSGARRARVGGTSQPITRPKRPSQGGLSQPVAAIPQVPPAARIAGWASDEQRVGRGAHRAPGVGAHGSASARAGGAPLPRGSTSSAASIPPRARPRGNALRRSPPRS
jgi:hypothetical protein